jgi:hypothetical protein
VAFRLKNFSDSIGLGVFYRNSQIIGNISSAIIRWATFRYWLKGHVGVLADSKSKERRLMVLPFVLESMPSQPARPFSEGIAHLMVAYFI